MISKTAVLAKIVVDTAENETDRPRTSLLKFLGHRGSEWIAKGS